MVNKRWLISTSLIICILATLFVVLQPAQALTDAIVDFRPDSTDVEPGSNFAVTVWMMFVSTPPIFDYDFFLSYDASQMTPVDAWDGGFLQSPVIFSWEVLDDFYGPSVSAVHVWADTTDGGSTGSEVPLAYVEFQCDNPGQSTITLEEISLSDDLGDWLVPGIDTNTAQVNQNVPPATAWIDPADYTVPVCTPFPVSVMVDIPAGFDLASFQLVLNYNTAFVDCIDIVPGDFAQPPVSVDHKVIDDVLGVIEFDVSTTAPGGSTGSGSIAKVTFHCTGSGESILTISSLNLYTSQGWLIPTASIDGRVVQVEYWEPLKLQDLVELPYAYHMTDLPFVPPGSAEGYEEVKAELEAKGFVFDPDVGGGLYQVDSFFDVYFDPGSDPFNGTVASWWSSNTLEDGTRACMLSAEMSDGSSMAMGFVTNLLPPDQIPGIDPYIIYNAEPYFFIDFYWWAWAPMGKVVHFYYWWHDSHNHPNWFWGPYWWWRCYVKAYYYPYTVVPYWRPWWSWWWHWVYWRHWYWWSSYFPYDP